MSSINGILRGHPLDVAAHLHGYRNIYSGIFFLFNPDRPWYQYVHPLGSGATAEALMFAEMSSTGAFIRNVVVKVAQDPAEDVTIENDKYWLWILRNSRHIVNPIHIDQERLTRPFLMTELLSFGTLYDIQSRVLYLDYQWPSRLMWRIFLCCRYLTLELSPLCLWTELPVV